MKNELEQQEYLNDLFDQMFIAVLPKMDWQTKNAEIQASMAIEAIKKRRGWK